ncbi:hypothetical protein GW888_01605 [Candidatus Wolfebacteria bacterium]|uniref:Uncharacterized protein n=2 Tax=Parcubacteria group TaxID=1794811 RepID=A0A2M7H0T4_9BACT|nr:hypothetical protein [Candidatus Wolfebacteria bacterium]PIW34721.1 MAG: hypothetical protein COW25_02435 [Candidatus Nealsonbacteria bacterium CG15_BIG_FIL_POST_REV_8_21_14_020_37_12]PIZ45123.1 MAG: hypothetical protein COY31_00990 [Candidatus Wolfebacteria bacterium CG_4_10_14_0_2_um_filter_39_18]
MDINRKKFDELLKKIEDAKKSGSLDLSTEEDLSIAIMNLISLEEHFYFTGEKTGKEDYFNLLNETREMRKNLLAKMIDKKEGELWCVSKHLLATSMRLIEVGTKLQSDSKKAEAKKFFDYAFKLYSLFWALRLKIISVPDVKNMAAQGNKPWTLEDVVNKLVDCCDE